MVMKPISKKQILSSIGKRKAFTIYVDKRVFYRFKELVEKEGSSVSRELEAYMYSEIIRRERRRR